MRTSLINDALIAASCGEAGVMLVTGNVPDFDRLARYIPFRFSPRWPTI